MRKVNAKKCHYVFQLKKPLRSVTPGANAGERRMIHVLTVHWFVLKFSISCYVLLGGCDSIVWRVNLTQSLQLLTGFLLNNWIHEIYGRRLY